MVSSSEVPLLWKWNGNGHFAAYLVFWKQGFVSKQAKR